MYIRRIGIIAMTLVVGLLLGFRLHAEGSIRGRITDEKKNPFPAAQITLKGPQGVRHTTTDTAGDYWIYGLTPGDYVLTLSAESRTSAVFTCVTVRSGHLLNFNWMITEGDELIAIKICGREMIDVTASNTSFYLSRDMLEKFYR